MKASNGFDVVCQLAVGERGQSEEPSVQEGGQQKLCGSLGIVESVGSNHPRELLLLALKMRKKKMVKKYLCWAN